MDPKAKICVSSTSSMADEKLQISMQGLTAHASVTLKMEVTTDEGFLFKSFGRFKADASGWVNLSRDQSYGGSYRGIDQMGLLCSLEPSAEIVQRFPRYHKIDVKQPLKFSLFLYNIDVTTMEELDQLQSDGKLEEFELDSCVFERWFMKPGFKIEPKTYEKDGFLGTLFLPPGEGPYPGVIVMFGGYPGLLEFKASLLASHGFASLALAFHGPNMGSFVFEDDIVCADLGYFKTAVDFMIGHPNIISSGVGLMSISFSVHIALMMATYLDHIHCVICVNGYIWNLNILYRLGDQRMEGEDYGFFKQFQRHMEDGTNVRLSHDLYTKISVSHLLSLEGKGLIPFYNKKNIGYMMIAGLEDQCLPADHYADVFKILLEDAKHPNFEVHKYVGAGHLIEPPYGPLNKITRLQGKAMMWGGEKVAHAVAQEDSWPKQIEFLFRNIVGRGSNL